MSGPELLSVPADFSSGRIDIASGVARMSATLWATMWRPERKAAKEVAAVFVHPTSNFMGHYALPLLAERGIQAVGMSTRYVGNDSTLIVENCLLDIAAVINHLRDQQGIESVVLVGNSGGGSLVSLYQSQAERPTITRTPAGDPVDLTRLPPAQALVLAMAHPGRARVYTDSLDAAIVDENEPFRRNPDLDIYRGDVKPPFAADFVDRYRQGQRDRNARITRWVRAKLTELQQLDGPDDLPFVVHGTAADPRFIDLSLDPSDRDVNTILGDPWKANFLPARLGHHTSLRSWLSQWSLEDSRSDAVRELPHVSVPVQIIYGTADNAVFPSHAKEMYEAVSHGDKDLITLKGADHYFRSRPDLRDAMCDHIRDWCDRPTLSTHPSS